MFARPRFAAKRRLASSKHLLDEVVATRLCVTILLNLSVLWSSPQGDS